MESRKKTKRRIKFQFYSENAGTVKLLGDFNNWEPAKHPMNPIADGLWEKIIMLDPGRYEYKFLVDGEWELDAENSKKCRNEFGSENSVMDVPARESSEL
ncbi:MAG: glycogen-binding domain-containing protein [Desulfobacterales bacterium]|jgi:1,4-alpha-glucan branching enzyme